MLAEVISHRPPPGRPGHHWGRGRWGHITKAGVVERPGARQCPFIPSCLTTPSSPAALRAGSKEQACTGVLGQVRWPCFQPSPL